MTEQLMAGRAEPHLHPAPPGNDRHMPSVDRPVPRITIHAFCETAETADSVRYASKDRRLSKAHVAVHGGGLLAAGPHYHQAPTPNLLIVEDMGTKEAIAQHLVSLAEVCDPGTKVIV